MLKVGIKYCGGCNPGYDRVALADFSDCPETFVNINTAEQRDRLQGEGLLS